MASGAVRVLLIEDEESDYLLTRRMLSSVEGQSFEIEWADSWQAGISDRRLDVEAMQLGAADYLVKDKLNPELLERSIRYAMAQAEALRELQRRQDELRASELRFRSVVESAADAIVLADESAKIVFWNRGAELIFGFCKGNTSVEFKTADISLEAK